MKVGPPKPCGPNLRGETEWPKTLSPMLCFIFRVRPMIFRSKILFRNKKRRLGRILFVKLGKLLMGPKPCGPKM